MVTSKDLQRSTVLVRLNFVFVRDLTRALRGALNMTSHIESQPTRRIECLPAGHIVTELSSQLPRLSNAPQILPSDQPEGAR